jgi:DNA-binding transcriptional ArsR family regulator
MLSILNDAPKQDKASLRLVARDGRTVSEEDAPAYDASPPPKGDEPKAPFCMMPHVIVRDYARKIGPIALSVYLVLADRANSDKIAWPSYETIAETLGVSRPTVIKAIAVLTEHGLVKVERRKDPNGRDKSHVYHLPLHCTYRVKDFDPRVNGFDPSSSTYRVKDFDDGGKDSLPTGVKDFYPEEEPYRRENPPSSPPQGEEPPEPAKRATRAPATFDLTEQHFTFAAKHGVDRERAQTETAIFLDRNRAKGETFVDWQAAWRTWMRRVTRYDSTGYKAKPSQSEINRGGQGFVG